MVRKLKIVLSVFILISTNCVADGIQELNESTFKEQWYPFEPEHPWPFLIDSLLLICISGDTEAEDVIYFKDNLYGDLYYLSEPNNSAVWNSLELLSPDQIIKNKFFIGPKYSVKDFIRRGKWMCKRKT